MRDLLTDRFLFLRPSPCIRLSIITEITFQHCSDREDLMDNLSDDDLDDIGDASASEEGK